MIEYINSKLHTFFIKSICGVDTIHQLEPIFQLNSFPIFKVGKSVWKVVSQEDKIEQARNDCILNVAAYVKANPRARPMEIQKKVQDEIEIFKTKIQ